MICKRCKEDKPLSDFWNSKSYKSGKDPVCAKCRTTRISYHDKKIKDSMPQIIFPKMYFHKQETIEYGQYFTILDKYKNTYIPEIKQIEHIPFPEPLPFTFDEEDKSTYEWKFINNLIGLNHD